MAVKQATTAMRGTAAQSMRHRAAITSTTAMITKAAKIEKRGKTRMPKARVRP